MNLKISNTLIHSLSKTTNLELLKLITSILSLLVQCPECREDLIMNSCIEECMRIYRKLDHDDMKILFVRVIAKSGENDLGLMKIKRLGTINIFYEGLKDCRNKTLIYHFAMAFLIFSKDPDIYKTLLKNKFIVMLENISFTQVKDPEDLNALLYGINIFAKRATESNLSELFLVKK